MFLKLFGLIATMGAGFALGRAPMLIRVRIAVLAVRRNAVRRLARAAPARVVSISVVLASAAAAACASNTTPERSFATRVEAQQGGGFDAGWLPDAMVPPSGRNIRARRHLGTNELWARFEFDASERPRLGAGCARIGQDQLRLPASQTRGIGWWPEMLRSDPGVAAQQFEAYICQGDTRLAVHRSLETAFVWRRPGRE